MGATDNVTDPAKLDLIATTQAEDNELRRVEVSRSFVCKCDGACEPQHAHPRTQRIQ